MHDALTHDVDAGLRLGRALWKFWEERGYQTEGREHLTGLLALPGTKPYTAARAGALERAGAWASSQGDYGAARALLEESLAIFRELGDNAGIAWSLGFLGTVARELGDYGAAGTHFGESLAIFREMDNKPGMNYSLRGLGTAARDQGEYGAARARFEESLAI
jgi:tetratricopeptide (TPR) repeat protein